MSRISGAEANSTLRIVRAIWHNPRISRVDIAARTGLDKSTVTNRVSRLIELGMVREIAEGSAGLKGGRKPIHLAINPSYGRTIGLEVQVESYTAVVTDLSGEVLGETKGRTRIGPGDFSAVVLGIIEESIGKLCPDPSLLLGIGVGTGGLVDQKKGRIRYSVPLGIDAPIDFVKAVTPRLPVPCYLENDA
ncbi:MAG TPA: winged helix-turn-helix transcriptional regulator, partial [Rectinemataceae bacterium]|nr:winged helix-turn-helix transcriptional regulator [Rectinemataceae bacterium]